MRATIPPIILIKAHMATVGMMAKGSIVTRLLSPLFFLFLLPNYIHVMQS